MSNAGLLCPSTTSRKPLPTPRYDVKSARWVESPDAASAPRGVVEPEATVRPEASTSCHASGCADELTTVARFGPSGRYPSWLIRTGESSGAAVGAAAVGAGPAAPVASVSVPARASAVTRPTAATRQRRRTPGKGEVMGCSWAGRDGVGALPRSVAWSCHCVNHSCGIGAGGRIRGAGQHRAQPHFRGGDVHYGAGLCEQLVAGAQGVVDGLVLGEHDVRGTRADSRSFTASRTPLRDKPIWVASRGSGGRRAPGDSSPD
ncbi:hypothetical protein SUDANB180_00604 [Streptomyces sp. enrichment culture]